MNDTTGFCVPLALMKSAASSSAVPPISPIMMMPSVCRHSRKQQETAACHRNGKGEHSFRDPKRGERFSSPISWCRWGGHNPLPFAPCCRPMHTESCHCT
jgi:hypothetical protein